MEKYLTYRDRYGNLFAMRCDRCYNGVAVAHVANKVVCADCRKENK